MILLNPRRSRRRNRKSRSYHAPRKSYRRRGRRSNPFTAFNPMRSLGSAGKGFSVSAIKEAVPLAVGAMSNVWLQEKAAGMIGPRIGMDLHSGYKNILTGTLTAGALSLVPKYGSRLFAGAMMQVAVKALLPYIPGYEDLKPVPPPPPPPPPAPAGPTFSGLGRPWIPAYSDEMEGHPMMHRALPHPAAHPVHARRVPAHAAMHGLGFDDIE
jgi:hypothetical protein